MAARQILARAEPGFTLPAFERLAAPPPPDLAAARLEANSAPGDIVADLHGRGGWIARAAVDRQRRAFSLETSPLTRLLAEVVLRPPDLRHIDAAFSALSASPRGETSLKLAIGELFSTRCATCGRVVTADEFTWSSHGEDADGEPAGSDVEERHAGIRSHDGGGIRRAPPTDGNPAVLIRKQYRCPVCRAQQGGPEVRNALPDEDDLARARKDIGAGPLRRKLRERFPMPRGGDPLVEAILNLHTDRQLVGLAAILDRVEGDLRAAPVEGALRLTFLHAVLPASRLGGSRGLPSLRIAGGTVRTPVPDPWRERNPWLAFEDAFRTVRAFVQRLESGAIGPLEARLGTDLRSLKEGPATAVVRTMTPSALETFGAEARDQGREPGSRGPARPKIRLILSQPPARFSQERLGAAYHGTCWALGREAASLLPLEPLLGPAIRAPWSWQAATLRRSLEVAAPHMARDGRAVLLLENGGPEALVAAALGGVGAGYRLLDARLAEPDEDGGGIVELVPPGGVMPPGARTRSNVLLRGDPRGSGDPDLVPGPGLFAPAERIDARPFSATEAARSITDTAVEVLRARGEPARYERLLGEILVGLDRSGQLRRLVAAEAAPSRSADHAAEAHDAEAGTGPEGTRSTVRARLSARAAAAAGGAATGGAFGAAGASAASAAGAASADRPVGVADVLPGLALTAPVERADPVEQVLALVREELNRPSQRRVLEIEPDRWWLAERSDLESAAVPLADRVEWAVYSLLSTAGPIDEGAFFERIAALFIGHDLPDEALVRACLASYRSSASTHDRLVTGEDLRARTGEHTELLALLANAGHRLGMTVSLGRREQERRIGQRTLDQYLDPREREAWLPSIARAPAEDLENVDCIWYLRGRGAFMFEVEWTAMLGDVLLRRHARIPSSDGLVRILALAPERTELARHKLDSSPILRTAIEAGNWHVILWPHLRSWLARDPFDLISLEPYLGLEPPIDRRGEQMGLFDRPEAVR